MSYVTHLDAPDRDAAEQAAERLAKSLRRLCPEYGIRVSENIRSRFEVVIEVPFRTEHRPWSEL